MFAIIILSFTLNVILALENGGITNNQTSKVRSRLEFSDIAQKAMQFNESSESLPRENVFPCISPNKQFAYWKTIKNASGENVNMNDISPVNVWKYGEESVNRLYNTTDFYLLDVKYPNQAMLLLSVAERDVESHIQVTNKYVLTLIRHKREPHKINVYFFDLLSKLFATQTFESSSKLNQFMRLHDAQSIVWTFDREKKIFELYDIAKNEKVPVHYSDKFFDYENIASPFTENSFLISYLDESQHCPQKLNFENNKLNSISFQNYVLDSWTSTGYMCWKKYKVGYEHSVAITKENNHPLVYFNYKVCADKNFKTMHILTEICALNENILLLLAHNGVEISAKTINLLNSEIKSIDEDQIRLLEFFNLVRQVRFNNQNHNGILELS